jgi:hypothetical protein
VSRVGGLRGGPSGSRQQAPARMGPGSEPPLGPHSRSPARGRGCRVCPGREGKTGRTSIAERFSRLQFRESTAMVCRVLENGFGELGSPAPTMTCVAPRPRREGHRALQFFAVFHGVAATAPSRGRQQVAGRSERRTADQARGAKQPRTAARGVSRAAKLWKRTDFSSLGSPGARTRDIRGWWSRCRRANRCASTKYGLPTGKKRCISPPRGSGQARRHDALVSLIRDQRL